MAKGPLITRSELRRRQQMQAQESLKRQRKEEAAYQQEEKKIASFYRKENKKNKPITKTRVSEREKTKKWNSFLIFVKTALILIRCVKDFRGMQNVTIINYRSIKLHKTFWNS